MPTHFKLLYADARGLGEVARLILHYAGVDFEDDRSVTFEKIEKIRNELPFGQVPVLIIDGTHKIAQSYAIYRFLGREFGLSGQNNVESALVDSYADFIKDLMKHCDEYMYSLDGTYGDPKKSNELGKSANNYVKNKFEVYLNRVVDESKSGFFLPSGLSWADFVAANYYESAKNVGMDCVVNVRGLKTIYDNVYNLLQLQSYLSSRRHYIL
ncbi:unnamed protein product [Bursaphelenchus xylophilus]|uniref:glutathione transferase n=1 Tax=Bursaphelenchus xylophilus TaxID=6326 RepID=A0A1I7RZW3_BURXY|nr:unnamed protein product [Bursaphelenchus xylophilus]CAG9109186.1 unnamed protein product [Bursaphelenchus xylophilus]